MNEVGLPNDPNGVFWIHPTPDFEVSWVGPNPCGPGFCLASDDGRLRFTDENFTTTGSMEGVSASAEAVNGVAHSQHWTAVTTRADINLIGPFPGPDAPNPSLVIDCGAFGVAAAPSGHFVVPLGRTGIMYVNPASLPDDHVMVAAIEQAGLNLYRVLPLPRDNGNDLIVCAGRSGGVGVTNFGTDVKKHSLSTLRFDDLDGWNRAIP